jgi:hypothetical protein
MRECPHCQFLLVPGSDTCRFCGKSLLLPPPDAATACAAPGSGLALSVGPSPNSVVGGPPVRSRRWSPLVGAVALVGVVATVGLVAVGRSGSAASTGDLGSVSTTTLVFTGSADSATASPAGVPDSKPTAGTVDQGERGFLAIGTRVDVPLILGETVAPTGRWAIGFPGEPTWTQGKSGDVDIDELRYDMAPFAVLIASEIRDVELATAPADELLGAMASPFVGNDQCESSVTDPIDAFGGRAITVEATCDQRIRFAATFVAVNGRLFSLAVEGNLRQAQSISACG